MIDLHCHIIPDTDDGAADLHEAALMMKIAVESGTKAMVATPHVIEGAWLPFWPDIVMKCQRLQTMAKELNLDLTIYPGAEVCVNWDMLDKISGPGPYCINGSRYMLVELPAMEIPGFTDEFLFALQTRGITPVVAHPERHPSIIKEPRILAEWVGRGMLAQVNAPSLAGRFGVKVMRTAEYLLSNKLAHCIGSDAHGARTRKPDLAGPGEKIRKMLGEKYAGQLLLHKPKQIIADYGIEMDELPVLEPAGLTIGLRGRLSRLFG